MLQSNSAINEIKERLNIVDVLSSYIQLKKAGTNYKATCPFHHEKTASLMVSPSKQIWHCFGCNEGGDIFSFVMKYENIDFGEALKILAEKAGVQLPKYTGVDTAKDQYREKLYKINELAARYYHKVLEVSNAAEPARKYLQERGLSAATLKEWQIGFAPNEFHLLENFLLKNKFGKQELLDAGVVAKNQRNETYDRFFNRITFPIKNYAGAIVGFTARVLDKDAKAAKYINSPETQVYSKSRVIFGLYQAKQEIRRQDFAVVVEGNMDVISCHQAGFENVVASSGTAFTFEQLQTLSRLTKNLKFAFDADAAGAMATRRTLDLALKLGFSIYVVKIEGAKDPDELIKKDPKLFAKAIEEAPLYLDYFFEQVFKGYDPTSVEQKKKIAAELMPLLSSLTDKLEIAHYVKILADRLGVPEKTVYEMLAKKNSAIQNGGRAEKGQLSNPLLKNKTYAVEQKLLGFALFGKAYRDKILAETAPSEFSDPQIKTVLEAIFAQKPQDIDQFISSLGDLTELAKLCQFMVESEYHQFDGTPEFDRDFHQLLHEFKSNSTKIEMQSVITQMVLAEQKKDKQKLSELNKRFLELSKSLKDFGG